jgi:hypothetical protein
MRPRKSQIVNRKFLYLPAQKALNLQKVLHGQEHPPADGVAFKKVLFGNFKGIFGSTEAILFLLLAMFGLSLTWWNSGTDDVIGADFYQFWVVGQSLHNPDINNVYSQDARERLGADFLQKATLVANPRQVGAAKYRQTLETYSSPFLYAFFGPFSTGNYEVDFRNYRLLMLVCLCAGIGIFCRLLNHSWGLTFGAIAIFSHWFEPFSSDLRVGNVNSLQFAALAVYLWVITRIRWRYREILGGMLLGLVVTFKPNLVFVVGMLLVCWGVNRAIRRLLYHAVGGVLGVVVAVGVTAFSFGSMHCWIDWLSALHSLPDKIITVDLGNFSPARILSEEIGINLEIPLAILFGGLALALIWLRRPSAASLRNEITPGSNEFSEIFVVALGCLLVLLIPRLAWLHYYVFTIPAFLVLLRPADDVSGGFVVRQFLVILGILSFATTPMLCIGIPLTPRTQGLLMVCATLLLFLGLALFSRRTASVPALLPDESVILSEPDSHRR